MAEFDDDTALTRAGDAWRAFVTDRWMIGAGPNGGYLASILTRALVDCAPQPHPLTITFHYPTRPDVGPADVTARIDHAGRSHAFLSAELRQGDDLRVRATAVFGRRREDQLEEVTLVSPVVAAVDDCPVWARTDAPPEASFVARFERRVPLGVDPMEPTGGAAAELGGWTRLVDRDPDELAVPLFADCWPPAVFVRHGRGLAPTLELTVHFRKPPTTPWLWCHFRSRVLRGGYVEEDGELWGEDGALVAQSRQLARFAIAGRG